MNPPRAITTLATLTIASAAAFAQTAQNPSQPPLQATSQPETSVSPVTTQPAAPLSLRGPKYGLHSWEDDFSYLEGPPGSYKPDFLDPIKWIKLDKDWRLSLGGELRWREEFQTNRTYGANNPAEDSFGLYRAWLHADLQYRKLARVFVETIDAGYDDLDLPQQANQVNRWDIHQLFTDLHILGEDTPLTLRVGRQTISYGRQRLVEKSNWGNVGKKFDGARLMYRSDTFDIEGFFYKPVVFALYPYSAPLRPKINEGMDRTPDHYREEQSFYGMYSTYKGIKNQVVDFYFFGLNDKGFLTNANLKMGDLSVYTLGTRLAGTVGCFDHDTEFAGQWGTWAGDTIQAWMFATDEGYTFKNVGWTPRIGTGFNLATGDKNPADSAHQTFNQLFHQGPPFFGYEQLVGLQNVIAPEVNLTFQPIKDVTVKAQYNHFWLQEERDALYNSGGGASRRSLGGIAGNEVGDLFYLTASWQIDVHSNLLLGFEHFWADHVISRTGLSRDPNLFFIQYVFRF